MNTLFALMCAFSLVMQTSSAHAQDARGTLTANDRTAPLRHAVAYETDSATEPGFMDVVVVISDRQLAGDVVRSQEMLESMVREQGLAGLRVVFNPDAKVMSASPLHPAFTTFISSALWVKWEPKAYDEEKVAGRLHTDGLREEFRQRWQYDVSFTAPILLDPQARTVAPGQGGPPRQ